MKKWIAVCCAALLCMQAPFALALELTGLETETVTRDWETSAFFTRMQELTGIETHARAITDEEEYQKVLEAMAGGEIGADALFKAGLTREQEISLLDSGAIVDLAPLIEENMPNLSALLEAHPEWRQIISLEDGRIASLPLINEGERQVLVWINSAWLSQLGLDMPETTDELTDALRTMTESDPNGNLKRDEIGADLTGVFEMRWLLPYFGIVADDYNLARGEDGQIVFAPELPGYREFIELLIQWYAEGILPREAFTAVHSASSLTQQDDDPPVVSALLVSVAPYTHVPIDAATQYEPLLMPGPDGVTRWRDFLGEIWTGCFAVTSACEDPGEALRWADALYTEEGAILAYAGKEGEDYAYDENGKWSFITSTLRDVTDIRSQSLMYTGGTMPGIAPNAFLEKVDSDIDVHVLGAAAKARAVGERVTDAYCLGAEDQRRADALAATIGDLVDRGIARFATGEIELTDESYSAWLAELKAAGSDELVALFQGK